MMRKEISETTSPRATFVVVHGHILVLSHYAKFKS